MPRRPDDDDATERFGRGGSDYDRSAEPVTGPPASTGSSSTASSAGSADGSSEPPATGDASDRGGSRPAETGPKDAGATAARPAGRRLFRSGVVSRAATRGGASGEQERRRRRWFLSGISIGAAIIALALCAGVLGIVDAVSDSRERSADSRDARRQRDVGCLELEKRLNRLVPPGATTTPAARATAVRDENAAVRVYLAEPHDQWVQDAWRQLLDSRTVFADALDRQAKARTPAFYVAPRGSDGRAVAEQLAERSPAPCAGPIRRLAAPEL